MTEETEAEGVRIIRAMGDSPYMVHIGDPGGLYVEACAQNDTLAFYHNLGASPVPGMKEAVAKINILIGYYDQLVFGSPSFRDFAAGKTFSAELYVFSGHMDFPVASWCKGHIDWKVALD